MNFSSTIRGKVRLDREIRESVGRSEKLLVLVDISNMMGLQLLIKAIFIKGLKMLVNGFESIILQ